MKEQTTDLPHGHHEFNDGYHAYASAGTGYVAVIAERIPCNEDCHCDGMFLGAGCPGQWYLRGYPLAGDDTVVAFERGGRFVVTLGPETRNVYTRELSGEHEVIRTDEFLRVCPAQSNWIDCISKGSLIDDQLVGKMIKDDVLGIRPRMCPAVIDLWMGVCPRRTEGKKDRTISV